ncbi:hypothetical protein HID58_068460 [Brassica napus]|uniref:Uncharacterized protein n=1 Tax=Brassica napus TaxID=3708 RepID=A0ABQ7ZLM3_BRANA|nr:hypothetical protein HID58_068460 [Brassica napus]
MLNKSNSFGSIGSYIRLHLIGEAKTLVEIELSEEEPLQMMKYALLPSKCERCGQLKHKFKHCLQSVSESLIVTTDLSENPSNGSIVVAATETKKFLLPSNPSSTNLDVCNKSNEVHIVNYADVNDLVSLTTISVFENM